jgi:GNAT superfamily N-acetyltransferase
MDPLTPLLTWTLRPAVTADIAYVCDSWLASYKDYSVGGRGLRIPYLVNTNRKLGGIVSDAYYQHLTPKVNEVVQRATVLVAHPVDDPSTILGWVCAELHSTGPVVVHYVYVRAKYRHTGIARNLVFTALKALQEKTTDRQVVVSSITPCSRMQIDRYGWVLVDLAAFTLRAGRVAS